MGKLLLLLCMIQVSVNDSVTAFRADQLLFDVDELQKPTAPIPDHYPIDSEVLRFRIYGKQWRVVLADMGGSMLCGQTEWKDRLIYIDRNTVEVERPEILLHELMHALMFEKFSIKRMSGHQFIYSLSPALQKALADNPELVKYLVKH